MLLDPDDPQFDEKLTQKRRVDSFFARLVGDGGAILRSNATYASPDDLLTRLRQDVEHYLSKVLDEADAAAAREGGEKPGAQRRRIEIPAALKWWSWNCTS